jgi:hypothetical protein
MANHSAATVEQILQIRREADEGNINVRAWANALHCSPETIRRIARRDTHRDVGAAQGTFVRGQLQLRRNDDPTEEDLQASLSKLKEKMTIAPTTRAGVNSLLDQLTQEGKGDGKKNR